MQYSVFFSRIFGVLLFLMVITAPAMSENRTADLRVSALDTAPASAPGGPLFTTAVVTNEGDMISLSDTLYFFLSPDEEITSSDYEMGSAPISFIRPGESVPIRLVCTIPGSVPPGTYYSGAFPGGKHTIQSDSSEGNNTITGNTITITGEYIRPAEWYARTIGDLIFTYSNDERRLRNLAEFTRDPDLDVIAQENSEDMAVRQFFDHTNPDGEDPVDRAERHGYDQLKTLPDGRQFYGIGENIVKIPVGSSIYEFGEIDPDDPDRIARVAVESFMNSPPHKEALLLPEHEKIGIGVVFDGENYYATQNFF